MSGPDKLSAAANVREVRTLFSRVSRSFRFQVRGRNVSLLFLRYNVWLEILIWLLLYFLREIIPKPLATVDPWSSSQADTPSALSPLILHIPTLQHNGVNSSATNSACGFKSSADLQSFCGLQTVRALLSVAAKQLLPGIITTARDTVMA